MKCNPLRWMWGIVPVVILSWLAVQTEHQRIERDLAERTRTALEAKGLRWAGASFSGRDGIVTGRATDESDGPRAVSFARDVHGVRIVDNRAELIEKTDRFVWSATKTGRTVRLSGFAPNEETRTSIVQLTREKFPGFTVVDEMKLARGLVQPDTWLTGVNFGLTQLSRLTAGDAKMDNLDLSVAGDTDAFDSYRTVRSALGSQMPRGVRLASDAVRPPVVKPYTWAAKHGNNQVLLQGYVPSESSKADVFAATKAAFPRATVVDRTEIAGGAPQGFQPSALKSIADLSRLLSGTAEFSDTTAQLTGDAADEPTATAVMRGYQGGLGQGFRGTAAVQFPPPAVRPISPFVTGIAALGETVVLSGHAPTDEARASLIANARLLFPGRRIEDRLQIGPGAPDGWAQCTTAHVAALARLQTGRVVLTDRRAELTGATMDEALQSSLPQSARNQAGSACESTSRIELLAEPEPTLVWRAVRSGNEVVLDGDVSSPATRAALIDSARRQFPNANVVDRMRVVDFSGRRWGQTAEEGLGMLAQLRSGEVRLDRRRMTLSGEAPSNDTKAMALQALGRERDRGYTIAENVSVRTEQDIDAVRLRAEDEARRQDAIQRARVCQLSLQQAAREGVITFERASSTIAVASNATLDRIAAAARACPDLVVEIEGHTDSEGTAERNKGLSERRAQAVADYLVRVGIPTAKVKAVGYGDTQPVAPNDTAEGRARNRRIEFTVKAN